MNEFTEWDNKNKTFKEPLGSCFLNINEFFSTYERYKKPSRFTIHQCIGKTDIEGNKIYADSSIIRVPHFIDIDGVQNYLYRKVVWSDEYSSYMAKTLDDKDGVLWWVFEKNWKNLKIIDTLQENKLGLHDADS